MALGSLKVTLCLLFIYLYRQLFLSGSPDRKPIFLFLLFKNNDLIWLNLFPAKPFSLWHTESTSWFRLCDPGGFGTFFPVTAISEKQLFYEHFGAGFFACCWLEIIFKGAGDAELFCEELVPHFVPFGGAWPELGVLIPFRVRFVIFQWDHWDNWDNSVSLLWTVRDKLLSHPEHPLVSPGAAPHLAWLGGARDTNSCCSTKGWSVGMRGCAFFRVRGAGEAGFVLDQLLNSWFNFIHS